MTAWLASIYGKLLAVVPRWPTIWRALNLKIYGRIPWLAIVPVAAWILETINHRLSASVRLPTVMVLSFGGALLFSIAHALYAYGCPETIRRIGSEEEWAKESGRRRQQINEDLKNDAALQETLFEIVETCVKDRLETLTGEDAFTAEGIVIIRRYFYGVIEERTTTLGDHIGRLGQLTAESYRELTLANPRTRLACTLLIFLAAVPFGYEIAKRLVNIWHVAW
ncbi:hypothetical protein ACQR10_04850 [Bradyrhizobium sp. HKCCYLRH2060]|uniref:hypothetical protein n=1 Tax=Bradyrhizobium TaxID=374 RepID=UPI002916F271|nr:hypothetical protein [Bradyrhizobium sp. SZCCHNR3003]